MAVSKLMNYATLPWPNYAGKVEVDRAGGGATKNIVAPDTAWYLITAAGYWDQAIVDVDGQQIFVLQKIGDNTNPIYASMVLPIKKNTPIKLKSVGASSVILYRL